MNTKCQELLIVVIIIITSSDIIIGLSSRQGQTEPSMSWSLSGLDYPNSGLGATDPPVGSHAGLIGSKEAMASTLYQCTGSNTWICWLTIPETLAHREGERRDSSLTKIRCVITMGCGERKMDAGQAKTQKSIETLTTFMPKALCIISI